MSKDTMWCLMFLASAMLAYVFHPESRTRRTAAYLVCLAVWVYTIKVYLQA